MRFIGRILPWLAVAALFWLLSPGLIQSSSAAEEAVPEPAPVQAVLDCVAVVPGSPAAANVQERSQDHGTVSAIVRMQEEKPVLVLCDGNGWPLTGRSWVREAWAANPPESIPGS